MLYKNSDFVSPPPVLGPVEAAPEYRVIVDANNLTVEIENELSEYKVKSVFGVVGEGGIV